MIRELLISPAIMVIATGFTLSGCSLVNGDNNTSAVHLHDVTPSVIMHTGVQPYEEENQTDKTSSVDSP